MSLRPRAVVVHRRSEYDGLLAAHGTAQQAAFFLEQRGRTLDDLSERHDALAEALHVVSAAIPGEWRRADVERADLARFVFGPEDVIIAVGQDGLVANVAKYLNGQPVVGVDPEPGRNAGVLVTHEAPAIGRLLPLVVGEQVGFEARTLVEASTDDGQVLRALNEVYVGHASHQSARYRVAVPDGGSESQSSSGLLIGTGTGATGWLRSAWLERGSVMTLPSPVAPELCWFVREAWPSPTTGVGLTEGPLSDGESLEVTAESELVCFGDGIESDALKLGWGQQLTVARSDRVLRLVNG